MTLSLSFLKKYSSFIVLLMLILAMSGIVLFGIVPLKQSLDDKMRGIQEFYAGQENREKQVSRLPELKDQYDVIVQNEPTLNILITDEQIVDFIKTLEGLASDMNVRMTITSKENGQIIEPKKAPAKAVPAKSSDASATSDTPDTPSVKSKVTNIIDDAPFARYLHLNISAEGQYTNIVAFLRKIETLPTGLDVIGLEIKKVEGDTSGSTISRTTNNPFALVGDGNASSQVNSQVVQSNTLQATFDVLVYVDKKD